MADITDRPRSSVDITHTTLSVIVLVLLGAAAFWVLRPFLTSIIWATIVSVAALAAASSAFAGSEATIHFNAKIRTVSHGDKMEYYGRARSNLEACQVGRTVRISAGLLIGQTGTDAGGKFSLVANPVEDGATVKFKLTRNGSDCPAQTLFVDL